MEPVYLQREIQSLQRSFKDHKAVLLGNKLTWAQPGTLIYKVVYLIDGNYLFVTGDIGEAIFRWPQPISFKFLASFSLEYFKEKCVAKPSDIECRQFDQWCGRELRSCAEDQLKTMEEEGHDQELIRELRDALDNLEHSHRCEWQQFLNMTDMPKLDAELWSILHDAGYRTDSRCRGMHMGIQLAMEQLNKGTVNV